MDLTRLQLKCTRMHPCSRCVASSSDCVFREDDVRRRPVSRSYVAALEERLASYEARLQVLQQDAPEQGQAPRQSNKPLATLGDGRSPAPELAFDYTGSSRMSTLTLQPDPQGMALLTASVSCIETS